MQEAWDEMTNFSVELPVTDALPGGDVLVVYCTGPEPDQTNMECVRGRGWHPSREALVAQPSHPPQQETR